MRSKICFIPLLGIYLMLMSATIVKKDTAYNGSQLAMPAVHATHVKAHKLNFFQRLALKYYLKKNKLKNDINADKLASTSLVLGISACGAIVSGAFYTIPYSCGYSIRNYCYGNRRQRRKKSYPADRQSQNR